MKPMINTDNIDLSGEFGQVLDLLLSSNDNYFVTGKAGTGKSTLLTCFREMTDKQMAIVCPTGIAGINVGGQTIHSFFQFPPTVMTPDRIPFPCAGSNRVELFNTLETLIIDEVSMVRADLLDAVDLFLRKTRGRNVPFGGVQVIMFGDAFQLEPVVSDETEREYFDLVYPTPFFFGSNVFLEGSFQTVYLTRIFRQKDENFIQILDKVRTGTITLAELQEFNNELLAHTTGNGESTIYLATTNKTADIVNQKKLEEIQEPQILFYGTITGKFQNTLPTKDRLQLKKGAQVMIIKNDQFGQWVNGTLGIVESCGEDMLNVATEEFLAKLQYETWDEIEYCLDRENKTIRPKVVGKYSQIPVKLAWALTIHKSQGLTFDHVELDLGRRAFSHGQVYTALSRCTTMQGIRLVRPIMKSDIIINPAVRVFWEAGIG